MNYKDFFKLYIESESFTNLPVNPYGFWVSHEGEFWSVMPYSHESRAIDIINEKKWKNKAKDFLEKKKEEYPSPNDFLLSMRFARVVISHSSAILYWNMGTGSLPSHLDHAILPSPRQMKTIKDLGNYYQVKIAKDK